MTDDRAGPSATVGADLAARFERRLARERRARREAERLLEGKSRELWEERERYRVLAEVLRGTIDSLIDPWVLLQAVRDAHGRTVDFAYADANDAACAANGLSRAGLIGARLLNLFPAHAETGLLERYAAVIDTGSPLALDDFAFPNPLLGAERRYDIRAVRVGDGLSFTWRDVTDRFALRQELARRAAHDPLTGLPNRQELQQRMEVLFARRPRTGALIAVLFCDLDRFKEVNDTLGHAVGDRVLREVAQRIRATVREQDVVSRLGGDEFVVVLDGVHDTATAMGVADKIRAAVGAPLPVADTLLHPSMSVGMAIADHGDDPDQVLREADVALYRAKDAGRDRIETLVYRP